MKVTETKLPGVLIFEPDVFSDERGFFLETWRTTHYENAGVKGHFVQDNVNPEPAQFLLKNLINRGPPVPYIGQQVHDVLQPMVFPLQPDIFDIF